MTEKESFDVDEEIIGYGKDDENSSEPRTFERGYQA